MAKMLAIWKRRFSQPLPCQNHIFTGADPPKSAWKTPRKCIARPPKSTFWAKHTSKEMKDDPRGAKKCVIWGGDFPRESVQNKLGRIFEPKVSPRRSRFAFGQLLAPLWNRLGATLGIMLEVVSEITLFCLHGSSFFESCYVFLGFYSIRGHSRNSNLTYIGALFSRFRSRFLLVF